MAIEIKRTNDSDAGRSWRAVVRIPRKLGLTGYGISGNQSEEGPWIEGYGYTPEAAVQAAMVTIGKAVVGMTEPPPKEEPKAPQVSS